MYFPCEGGRHCFRNLFDGHTRARESMCPESYDAIGTLIARGVIGWISASKRKHTFTDYFSKGIISDNSNLLRGQLLPKFVIGIGELRLVILRK